MKKILFSIVFLFLMIVIPKNVYALEMPCEQITSGSYTVGTNFNFEYGNYCINEGEEVVIDLNGQDITDQYIDIYNQGKLLIKDSNYTEKQFDLENLGDGEIYIYGDNELSNKGELTIDNGNFKYVAVEGIKKVTINNGLFVGGFYIEQVENIEINDGNFNAREQAGLYAEGIGSMVINGGTYESSNQSLYIMYFDSLEINGGTFKSDFIGLMMQNESDYNVTISKGKFTSTTYGIQDYSFPIVIIGENSDFFNQFLKEGASYVNEFPVRIMEGATVADIAEVEVLPPPGEYHILEGKNQEIEVGTNLTVRADGEVANFVKLLVDGEEVAPENYEISDGSTIITLKSDFLMSLKEGNHDITFVYVNGEVSTKFTIKAADTESGNIDVPSSTGTAKTNLGPKKIKVPSTGMTVPIIVSIIIICSLLIGGIIFGYSYMKSKKERKKVQ